MNKACMTKTKVKFNEGIYSYIELGYHMFGRFDGKNSMFYPIIHTFSSSDERNWYMEWVDGELKFVPPHMNVTEKEPFKIEEDILRGEDELCYLELTFTEDRLDDFKKWVDDYKAEAAFRVYNIHLVKPVAELND